MCNVPKYRNILLNVALRLRCGCGYFFNLLETITVDGEDAFEFLIDYTPNTAWDTIGTHSYTELTKVDAQIHFEVTLKRKPIYGMMTMVFPVIVHVLQYWF